MISSGQIREIIAQYEKHGWTLRRVFLSPPTRESPGVDENIFGETPVTPAEIDAVWFSRPSASGGEAWELRRLSGSPFALIEIFDDEDDETVRDEIRHEIERQMESGKRKIEK